MNDDAASNGESLESEAIEASEPAPPGVEVPPSITFADLGLGPSVLQALQDMGFTGPMHVQAQTIPLIVEGKDLLVQSRTGSGKTAAFGIPLVDRIARGDDKFVQAIVLLPTRELALQVASELARIAAHSNITVVPVYGGAPMGRQIEQLRAGGQIVCGTPGRILDHLRRGTLKLDRVRCAVLDESDEMLSMGFQEDIEHILDETPAERQTLLFSATVPDGIQRLSRRYMRNPEFVKLSADFVGVHEIRHVYYAIPGGQRENELLRVVAFENPEKAIVFCNTREETGRVAEFLRRQGFESEAISSDLSQSDREKVMSRMRAGGIRFLVATDVAARGIDLEALSHVINYTFPESPEVYIHRTGRTGRAGRHGTAISLIGPPEVGPFYYVKLLYKIRPEERSLPSEAEIRSKREGERILALRARFPEDPGAGWRSLARRVMSSVDGEQLCAALLAEFLSKGVVAAPKPVARNSIVTGTPGRPEREPRESRGPRFDRDRPGEGRDRDRPRPPGGDRDRPRLRGRERDRDRPAREERPALEGQPPREERPALDSQTPREERPALDSRPPREERPALDSRPPREPRPPLDSRPPREERPALGSRPPREPRPAREDRPLREERPAREDRPAPVGRTADSPTAAPRIPTERFESGDLAPRRERAPEREGSPERMGEEGRVPRPRLGSERSSVGTPVPPPREPKAPPSVGGPPPGSDGEFWSVWSEEQGRQAAAGLPPLDGDSPRPPGDASAGLRSERRPERSGRPEREGRGERSRRTPESVEVVPAVAEPRSSFDGPKDGESRLFLNLGRKDDATFDEVASLFADLGVNLGPADIEVMNTHSYVNVPADEAERVCNDLTGRDRDGRKLSCEPARPRRR